MSFLAENFRDNFVSALDVAETPHVAIVDTAAVGVPKSAVAAHSDEVVVLKTEKKNKMKPSWSLKNGNKIGVTTFSHSEVCDGVGCHCNFKNSTWCDVESSDICYGGDLYNEKLWICKHMEQSLSAKKIREMF